jgi:hypothetical protein
MLVKHPSVNLQKEKRKLQRFVVTIPARIKPEAEAASLPSWQHHFTRDLSASGAFLLTQQPLPVGTTVMVRLLLPPLYNKRSQDKRAQITVRGAVVRIDEDGMGIRFERNYKIVSAGGKLTKA